ncbi:MYND-type zinc finger protein samB [Parastagonospora nodorum]|uniref:MYND-type zinc finger protein samB n=2 Tax=Phaeosphaeria nodorum (strain SN15 / ATCC MYA-4574 / FGSC 10173) TaxID=321614 RepID=A0A7U2IDD0_PHANO|nr:hypothetical protein SNOG_16168 [Parastagonospora nodorum SN15]KAH3904508.1 MYND-type zinc finger protein samB [Parastagonospora nodorum]EAT76352.1 hypothetical protein SNOG_16168 [Parastagonospora nodorum SN15]KAH3921429.1 MYND-type zinc finger protein samB [Parastagonospora nodorum]KAH3939895.1 MYND-type zinc finger protein samB [Parastagonospora nodorum]KAH3956988.1 MYND-type zinc finger protein samB [Parastagonospora nodorum]
MASANVISNFARGPRGSLKHRCAHCGTGDTHKPLLICAGCKAVRYCTKDHQIEHRARHKCACRAINKCRKKLEAEEDGVRNSTDPMWPGNLFEQSSGRFWGVLPTRPYMRARFALLNSLRRMGTFDGVKEGHSHLMDMMRLCRSDNMGLRQMIPAVLLQLDQDQECYDFIKWYATVGQDSHYDWGNMDLPFLDVKNANVYEDPSYVTGEYGDPHHITALVLLKLKLIQDTINVRLVRKVIAAASKHLPREVQICIETAVVRSPLSTHLYKQNSVDLLAMELKIARHVKILGAKLTEANPFVISGLLRPDEWLDDLPEYTSTGSAEEMQLVLYYGYPAWLQTQGALELLENARKNAEKDSADEIEDTLKHIRLQGDTRTGAELLDDMSLNRIWGYFDWAVEDAVSLASERPSDIHRRTNKEMWDAPVKEEEDMFSDSEDDSREDEEDALHTRAIFA